jgi:hypothetical protein
LTDEDVVAIREQFDQLSGTNLDRYRILAQQFQCGVRSIERIVARQFFRNVEPKTMPVTNQFSFLARLKQ